jgi:hypothetical protein
VCPPKLVVPVTPVPDAPQEATATATRAKEAQVIKAKAWRMVGLYPVSPLI